MSLQFISGSTGKTTGVFISINKWNDLKDKFKSIEQDESIMTEWHLDIVRKRINDYKNNPEIAIDFDAAMIEIEKGL